MDNCPLCQHKIAKYWHTLTPGLVKVLVKFRARVCEKNENRVHVAHELELSHSEFANFQKLRYFGLVAHSEPQGYWLITRRGAQFLNGHISVPSKVQTYHNEIVERSPELVGIKDVIGEIPYFEEKSDFLANIESVDLPNHKEWLADINGQFMFI